VQELLKRSPLSVTLPPDEASALKALGYGGER